MPLPAMKTKMMSLAPFVPASRQHLNRRSEDDLMFPAGAARPVAHRTRYSACHHLGPEALRCAKFCEGKILRADEAKRGEALMVVGGQEGFGTLRGADGRAGVGSGSKILEEVEFAVPSR